ncbi:hypothetical protein [Halococcus sp. IIIV-5B]|uniref:hypothetical protein n=1 Tax=Halococcus sp. IIIV-5B TaxID=2321230 RepID=UPI000E75BE63|nr:hypothetical protein [Halococcus sp. IIIV-5B]RJT03168.1 hypothetical protein D3261_11845 [Halococcus sp. IIIV-5B]
MNDCPLCGAPLPEERPRHKVTLKARDDTRSVAEPETMAPETSTGHRRYQVCRDCWETLKTDLAGHDAES